jgi:hypothetical protein
VLRNKSLKQIINAICNHPPARIFLLRGEVATVQLCSKYLLGGYASLIEGHPAVGSDGVFP